MRCPDVQTSSLHLYHKKQMDVIKGNMHIDVRAKYDY